jgi:DNA invertase Pin-like site-specific DNA recombinase
VPIAAIYCRISLDRTDESESPERQEMAVRAFLASKGYEVGEVFVDRDVSAYNGATRPEYERMMRGVAEGRFDAVAVWKLDRLTRRFTDTGTIIEALNKAGATLLSAHEVIDTSTPMGQAIVGLLAAQAEQESKNTSMRVKAAWEAQAKAGKPHLGGPRCFGYTHDMEINPEEAVVVREMANRVLSGDSLRKIATDLNERDIITTRGGKWSAQRVGQYLRQPAPAGIRTHNGEEHPGDWVAIIEPEQRLEVIQVLAQRGGGGQSGKPKHLLPGLVFCGKCGGRLKTMGFRQHNGKNFERYQCVKHPGGINCGGIAVALNSIEAYVKDEFLRYLSLSELRPLPDEHRDAELRRLVTEDSESLMELTRSRFLERKISGDEYEIVSKELRERIESHKATLQARERQARLRKRALRPGSREDLETWWEAASLEDRRIALRHAIHRVVVDPAKRRGGNVFDKERVRIEWSWSFYIRRAKAWEEAATPDDRERALAEYNEMKRNEDEREIEEALADCSDMSDADVRKVLEGHNIF